MTDRIADPQAVCPFVAFDDDRDFRSPVPDHRHRCFAESPAAPRALAHQAAYCLSTAFPGCPTFVDWARREAAPAKPEPAVRHLREHAEAPRVVPAAAPGTGAPAGRPAEPAPRASASDWSAPPPWGVVAGAAAGAAAGAGSGSPAGGGSAGRPEPEPIDEAYDEPPMEPERPAADAADDAPSRPADAPWASPAAAPSFLAGRSRATTPPPSWTDEGPPQVPPEDEPYAPPARRAPAEQPRVPVGYAAVAPSKERRVAGSSADRRDPAAPSWEQPRRFEAYPTLKSRGAGLPRPALYALVVILVGAGLFAAPFIFRGLGGGDGGASPTPAASASVEPTAEPSPTPEPTPEKIVYVVKSGDTLSKIAAKYDVTVDQVLEANPSIKNPNLIAPGDEIVIPQPLPSEIVNEDITEAPTPES